MASSNELFENNFGEWVEANGISLDHWVGEETWMSDVNLTKLKDGINELVKERMNEGKESEEETTPPKLPPEGVRVIHVDQAWMYGFPRRAQRGEGWTSADGRVWTKGNQSWHIATRREGKD